MARSPGHTRCALSPAVLLVLLLRHTLHVSAEIRSYNGNIAATSNYIHYSEGYIVAPGCVDLSGLVVSDAGDDENLYGHDSDSVIDIIFFLEPPECSDTLSGCDWTNLGVGSSDESGNLRWCCTDDAAELGFCDYTNHAGRLIINADKFRGQRRFVHVPSDGKFSVHVLPDSLFEVTNYTGHYIMAIANCNDLGRDVEIRGTYTWKSRWGFLPGDIFGVMLSAAILTFVYLILFCLYACAMHYKNQSIGVQKLILATVFLGFITHLISAIDYILWNMHGKRPSAVMTTATVLYALTRTISRSLVLLVSLGWCVVHHRLEEGKVFGVIFLSVTYAVFSMASDMVNNYAINNKQIMTYGVEGKLYVVMSILGILIFVINAAFFVWILCALIPAPGLEEAVKKGFVTFRRIFLFYVSCVTCWYLLVSVRSVMLYAPLMGSKNEWFVSKGAYEIFYLVLLISIMWLWRPSDNLTAPVLVTELPSVDFTTEPVSPKAANDDSFQEERKAAKGEDSMQKIEDDNAAVAL